MLWASFPGASPWAIFAGSLKLARKSEELAGILLERALEGKLGEAKMLVSLAEDKAPPKPRREKPSPLMKLAQKWASEPEWVEPEWATCGQAMDGNE